MPNIQRIQHARYETASREPGTPETLQFYGLSRFSKTERHQRLVRVGSLDQDLNSIEVEESQKKHVWENEDRKWVEMDAPFDTGHAGVRDASQGIGTLAV